LFAPVTGTTALFAKRLSGRLAIQLGGLTTAAALALLLLAASLHALSPFLLASALSGAGYSLLFLGGLTLINAHAPAHHRAGTLSAIYLIGYLLMGAIALALGVVATRWGLRLAIEIGASGIALLALAAAALALAGEPAPAFPVLPRRPVGGKT
jgi:MFS family permease